MEQSTRQDTPARGLEKPGNDNGQGWCKSEKQNAKTDFANITEDERCPKQLPEASWQEEAGTTSSVEARHTRANLSLLPNW